MATPEQIFNEALNLTPLEREKLVYDLSLSIEADRENQSDQYWADEVKRRIASHESGEVKMIPIEEMYKEFEEEDREDSED